MFPSIHVTATVLMVQLYSCLCLNYINISQTNSRKLGVIKFFKNAGIYFCAKQCKKWTECTSFNFHRGDLVCELVRENGQMSVSDGWIHVDNPDKVENEYLQLPENICDPRKKYTQYILSSGTTKCMPPVTPKDCQHVHEINGEPVSGIYQINPVGFRWIDVYCDEAGWTVFQRRINGEVDFLRNWNDYKNGFGNLSAEFWLGNDALHAIVSQGSYKLRIDLKDFDENTAYVEYLSFTIGGESSKYRIHRSGYSGTGGDVLQNEQKFSTIDQDNDNCLSLRCIAPVSCAAGTRKGGWWFDICLGPNLNGIYRTTPYIMLNFKGISWFPFRLGDYSLKATTMKIRR